YGYSCFPGGFPSSGNERNTKTAGILRVMPCSVSQLLSATEHKDSFFIKDMELQQVTVVGLIRSTKKTPTHLVFSLDDMTGPPLEVKQWLNLEEVNVNHSAIPPETYVKVTGGLRSIQHNRYIVAFNIRRLDDFNEITSHMLEVIQAHLHSASSSSSRMRNEAMTSCIINASHTSDPATVGFTANQRQVFNLIKSCHLAEGITLQCLKDSLKSLSFCDIRAGKPPPGLHLDVVKGDKLIEKLIIDEKKFYLFGRNPDHCDFTIDHQSCSRVHAALVYHRHLKRVFLIDLNSTHGTFLGRIRLESHKPQQVPIDSTMSFGASTRVYTLREKPQAQPSAAAGDSGVEDEELKGLLGLPEEETELDNLTEFNTAHNKRISTLTIEEGNLDLQRPKKKRRSSRVSFSEDEEIINPEDIDPSVGRFRNMVQTAIVPLK
ncbi:Nuclear inhibitor of protein phosphatase 1, partial [Clarias magur]